MMKQLDIQYQALRAKKLWRMSNSASATGSKKYLHTNDGVARELRKVSHDLYERYVRAAESGTHADNKRRLYHSKPISIEFTL